MLGFQVGRRISESILLQKWQKNASNVEDDAYETLIFAYNKELDLPILTGCITKRYVEKEGSPPYLKDFVMDLEEETTNLEDTTLITTPQFVTRSNKLNNPPMAPSLAQYVQNKFRQCL
jgi:hypothetical protein